jgi:hypothetical protein
VIDLFFNSSYGPFASSAIAGQSLASMFYHSTLAYKFNSSFRLKGNLSAAAFPLFTTQMYDALDYKWANTLFGGVAVLLVPIPFVGFRPFLFFLV